MSKKVSRVKRYHDHTSPAKHPILALILCFCIIGAIGGGVELRHINTTLPPVSRQRLLSMQSHTSEIKASDGTVIWGRNRNQEQVATKKDIPKRLTNALTSIEDRKFYTEGGVNYLRTLQAVMNDVIHHNRQQGGSTLTEQLVKNSLFSVMSSNDKTVKRKIQEIMLSDKVNHMYSKSTIMEMYVNKVFMGSGIFGMKTAAAYYFNKPLKDVSTSQAAILAGLVQSPTAYDPYAHPEAAKLRRNTVLMTMAENSKLSRREARRLCKQPLKDDVIPYSVKVKKSQNFERNQLIADDYTESTLGQLNKMNVSLNTRSLNIKTPLDMGAQRALFNIVEHRKNVPWPDNGVDAAATVINNKTGQVVAQVGSRHKQRIGSFNQAVSTERSTGSIIKPILDYAPAMDDLGWGTSHTVYDTPFKYPGTNTKVYDWDDEYQGKLTAARALMNSRNIPAVKTLHEVGLPHATALAKLAGLPNIPQYYSSAIGINASPAQIASAFSSLADYGIRRQISYLSSYQIAKNKAHDVDSPTFNVMSPQTAFMLTKVLEQIPQKHELGEDAMIDGVHQAGKTGTIGYANGNRGLSKDAISDSWYVGYTKGYTICVWTGYKNPKHYLMQKDADIAEMIYKDMMEYLVDHGGDTSDWSKPSNIESFHGDDMKQYAPKKPGKIVSPSLMDKR